jgi:hypothetical protein
MPVDRYDASSPNTVTKKRTCDGCVFLLLGDFFLGKSGMGRYSRAVRTHTAKYRKISEKIL